MDPKAKPVKQKLRQFGYEKDKVIKEEVAKLLEAGHIRDIQFSEWLSNAVMVPKGNTGTWRCVLISEILIKPALKVITHCQGLISW